MLSGTVEIAFTTSLALNNVFSGVEGRGPRYLDVIKPACLVPKIGVL
jgi:hypothetical protein